MPPIMPTDESDPELAPDCSSAEVLTEVALAVVVVLVGGDGMFSTSSITPPSASACWSASDDEKIPLARVEAAASAAASLATLISNDSWTEAGAIVSSTALADTPAAFATTALIEARVASS